MRVEQKFWQLNDGWQDVGPRIEGLIPKLYWYSVRANT